MSLFSSFTKKLGKVASFANRVSTVTNRIGGLASSVTKQANSIRSGVQGKPKNTPAIRIKK